MITTAIREHPTPHPCCTSHAYDAGWSLQELTLLGYGQGGTAALDLLLRPGLGLGGLNGVVGVATEVLPERLREAAPAPAPAPARGAAAAAPEVFLLHGARDEAVPVAAAEASTRRLRAALGDEHVRLRVFEDRGGEMVRGGHQEETRCLMEFLSDHLHGVGKRGSAEAPPRGSAVRLSRLGSGVPLLARASPRASS